MAKRKPVKATEKPARASEPGADNSSAGPDSQVATEQEQATGTAQAQQEPGNAASDVAPTPDTQANEQPADTADAGTQATGNVPGPASAAEREPVYHVRVRDRLQQHPEWKRIIATVREMRADTAIPAKGRETFIWGEMDRLYPELPPGDSSRTLSATRSGGEPVKTVETTSTPQVADTRVKGLGDLPPSWPEIPANASLAAEVGWVQAERLRIVDEKPGGATVVNLERARSPAPSWAALSWLETSIRSYAKFVEVAAKVSGSNADEQANVRRERMAIDEIRSILAQMQG